MIVVLAVFCAFAGYLAHPTDHVSLHAQTQAGAEIAARIKRFFETSDDAERREIARRIEAHKEYDPSKVSDWLHAAGLHRQFNSGLQTIEVALENSEQRRLSVRIPTGYTPDKRWPLILAYHPTGGTGEDMLRLVSRTLGKHVDEYIIAAPTSYLPLNIDSQRSWRPEQRLVLRELRKSFHVDSNQIYVTGFSQGCYATWSYATFFGDELAGAAPVACTFDAAPEIPGLWELLLPNVTNVPVLNVWGSEDHLPVYGIDLRTVVGVASRLNERLTELTKKLNLDVVNYRINGGGHAYDPPTDLLTKLLQKRRSPYPPQVQHRFRSMVQGRAYWLEALSWDGNQWGVTPIALERTSSETREQAVGRKITELLGQLDGKVHGQEISVSHKHVDSLIVWLGGEMIDWSKPIRITGNGEEVFRGKVSRNLLLCLREAARTYDFDRLRWAGVRVSRTGTAKLLTDDDQMPDVVYEKPR